MGRVFYEVVVFSNEIGGRSYNLIAEPRHE